MSQHTGQHPLCMELERVLCMILARAPYDPACCMSAVQVCKAYKARMKACCAGGYGGRGVEPGCAGPEEDEFANVEQESIEVENDLYKMTAKINLGDMKRRMLRFLKKIQYFYRDDMKLTDESIEKLCKNKSEFDKFVFDAKHENFEFDTLQQQYEIDTFGAASDWKDEMHALLNNFDPFVSMYAPDIDFTKDENGKKWQKLFDEMIKALSTHCSGRFFLTFSFDDQWNNEKQKIVYKVFQTNKLLECQLKSKNKNTRTAKLGAYVTYVDDGNESLTLLFDQTSLVGGDQSNGQDMKIGAKVFWIKDRTSNPELKEEPWIIQQRYEDEIKGPRFLIMRDKRPDIGKFVYLEDLMPWVDRHSLHQTEPPKLEDYLVKSNRKDVNP